MAASIVQHASTSPFGNVDSTNASFGSPVASGNTIVVCVWGYHNSASGGMFPSGCVTDSQGNTYNLVQERSADASVSCAVFYAYNVTGGSITITLDPLTTGNYGSWSASEVSGLLTTNPKDKDTSATQNNPASTTSSTGTTSTLAQADQIVFAVMCSVNNKLSITAVGSSWTEIVEELSYDNYNPGESVYRVVSTTTGQICNWTYLGAGRESAIIATFMADTPPSSEVPWLYQPHTVTLGGGM